MFSSLLRECVHIKCWCSSGQNRPEAWHGTNSGSLCRRGTDRSLIRNNINRVQTHFSIIICLGYFALLYCFFLTFYNNLKPSLRKLEQADTGLRHFSDLHHRKLTYVSMDLSDWSITAECCLTESQSVCVWKWQIIRIWFACLCKLSRRRLWRLQM